MKFLASTPRNLAVNAIESVSKVGLLFRGVGGTQGALQSYGETGNASAGSIAQGVFGGEISAYRVVTGQGSWNDVWGTAMMFLPVGQGKRDVENSFRSAADDAADGPVRDTETTRADEGEANRTNEDEGTTTRNTESESPTRPDEDGQAYEGGDTGANRRNGGLSEDGYRIEAEGIEVGTRSISEASFTPENIETVRQHLSREQFLEGGEMAANNTEMIRRLEAIERGELEATPTDQAFITHEIREAQLMSEGMSYDEAHAQTCKEYGITGEMERNSAFYTDEANAAYNDQLMNNLGF